MGGPSEQPRHGRRRLRALTLVMLGLALGACDPTTEESTSPSEPTSPPPASDESATSTPTTNLATTTDWSAPGIPPEGVLAQVNYLVAGGGGPCPPGDLDRVLPEPPFVIEAYGRRGTEIGWGIHGCAGGFDGGAEVDILLTSPSGHETAWTATVIGGFVDAHWFPSAGSELGEYALSVSDGRTTAGMTFAVDPATTPRLNNKVADLVSVWGGRGPVTFTAAGFSPDSVVPVYLYGLHFRDSTTEQRTYIGPLPAIEADSRGEALYELDVPAEAPAGSYCVVTPEMLAVVPDLADGDPCWGGGGVGILLGE